MNLLALNMVLPQSLRIRYQWALGTLPIVLMFASFLPLFRITKSLASALGIPENAPVKDHPNGALLMVLFLSSFIVLMLMGYMFGWVLNAALRRYECRRRGHCITAALTPPAPGADRAHLRGRLIPGRAASDSTAITYVLR